jgi:hypothetical protein
MQEAEEEEVWEAIRWENMAGGRELLEEETKSGLQSLRIRIPLASPLSGLVVCSRTL